MSHLLIKPDNRLHSTSISSIRLFAYFANLSFEAKPHIPHKEENNPSPQSTIQTGQQAFLLIQTLKETICTRSAIYLQSHAKM